MGSAELPIGWVYPSRMGSPMGIPIARVIFYLSEFWRCEVGVKVDVVCLFDAHTMDFLDPTFVSHPYPPQPAQTALIVATLVSSPHAEHTRVPGI